MTVQLHEYQVKRCCMKGQLSCSKLACELWQSVQPYTFGWALELVSECDIIESATPQKSRWLIMVIELSGRNLVWNHMSDFKIEQARSASSIWNHKYDFRPKLHDTKFNYHFMTPILKSHSCLSIWIFIYPFQDTRLFLEKGKFGQQKLPNPPPPKWLFVALSFPAIWLASVGKPWNLIGYYYFIFILMG